MLENIKILVGAAGVTMPEWHDDPAKGPGDQANTTELCYIKDITKVDQKPTITNL